MVKIAALTAAVLLIAWVASLVLAYKAGKKAKELSQDGVQHAVYRDMARWIGNTVNGTGLDSEYWASLSPKSTQKGEELLARYRKSIGQ